MASLKEESKPAADETSAVFVNVGKEVQKDNFLGIFCTHSTPDETFSSIQNRNL